MHNNLLQFTVLLTLHHAVVVTVCI